MCSYLKHLTSYLMEESDEDESEDSDETLDLEESDDLSSFFVETSFFSHRVSFVSCGLVSEAFESVICGNCFSFFDATPESSVVALLSFSSMFICSISLSSIPM